MIIKKVLTDNSTQFTDRFTSAGKQASGNHAFDIACAEFDIEHRLAPPRHPQTNGMVERFNGRISGLVAQTRFSSAAVLQTTLKFYLATYNHSIPSTAGRADYSSGSLLSLRTRSTKCDLLWRIPGIL